jgi:type VI secretion system Hcp family effector
MKKNLKFIAVVIFISVSLSGFSQAGVYLYSTNLPGESIAGQHNGETLITSYSRSYETPTTFTAGGVGGVSIGRASNGGLTILKAHNKSSIALKDALWRSTNLGKVEIRFYNSNNQIYYKITLGGTSGQAAVIVTSIIETGEICPSGCPGTTEEIKFIFGQVEERDLLSNPQIFKCWDFVRNNSNCAN